MLGGVKKCTMVDGGYELTLENGKVKRVPAITTKGVKQEGMFHHTVTFGDGTVQKHVVSTETMTIPDYPAMQPS